MPSLKPPWGLERCLVPACPQDPRAVGRAVLPVVCRCGLYCFTVRSFWEVIVACGIWRDVVSIYWFSLLLC